MSKGRVGRLTRVIWVMVRNGRGERECPYTGSGSIQQHGARRTLFRRRHKEYLGPPDGGLVLISAQQSRKLYKPMVRFTSRVAGSACG